jgi:methionyl-tRNA formyltransferase
MKLKVYLLGQKGLRALQALDTSFVKYIDCVIIGRDQKVQNDYSKELTEFCIKHELNYKIQNKTVEYVVGAYFNIAIGWRWIINDPNPIIVFHDSLLPKYRGFNPLVTALLNNDKEIGVTALVGGDDYDAGPIYGQVKAEISYPIKIEKAIDVISDLYGTLLNQIVKASIDGTLNSLKQDERFVSYSLWRDSQDYIIDWNQEAAYIKRMIDAVGYPYLGARTFVDNKTVVILDAEISEDIFIVNRTPGKVIFKKENNFFIVCGRGLLKVSSFYDENSSKIDFSDKFRLRFKS